MIERILILLVWLAVGTWFGGSAIKHIKEDHPYMGALDLSFVIYWTIRFGALFLRELGG
jgi:hypothetical protein